jgi:hypothetical protein
MNFKKYLLLYLVILVLYAIHSLVYYLLKINTNPFYYSIEKLYVFFTLLSTVMFKIVTKVKEKSFDNVGMSFLLATSLKMIFCYLILRPILHGPKTDNPIEKATFFGLFIFFLLIETLFTIRLVNEKEAK